MGLVLSAVGLVGAGLNNESRERTPTAVVGGRSPAAKLSCRHACFVERKSWSRAILVTADCVEDGVDLVSGELQTSAEGARVGTKDGVEVSEESVSL